MARKKLFVLRVHAQDNFKMAQLKVGDRVCIRGLIHSDCVGMTGTILEIGQSALFGPAVQRCDDGCGSPASHEPAAAPAAPDTAVQREEAPEAEEDESKMAQTYVQRADDEEEMA